MKTTRPDPQTCHACSSPAIRDDKVNHQVLTVESGFFSKLLKHFPSVSAPILTSSLFSFPLTFDWAAFDAATEGATSPSAVGNAFGNSPINGVNMTATGDGIPVSILEPFSLSSDQPIGTGSVTYWYASAILGGGRAGFGVTVDGMAAAVPQRECAGRNASER
jgi:hypothetical protein